MPKLYFQKTFIAFLILSAFYSCKDENRPKEKRVPFKEEVAIKKDSMVLNQRSSLYEIGDSITSYETNFKNLFENWNMPAIINAADYKLKDYKFEEQILDSLTFNKYRNFFTSNEVLSNSVRRSTKIDSKGNRTDSIYIYPGYLYEDMLNSIKNQGISDKNFEKKVLKVIEREMNIDTVNLLHHTSDKNEINTEKYVQWGTWFNSISNNSSRRFLNVYSIDSLSQNYIAVHIKNSKSFNDLSVEEKQNFTLEYLLINRLTTQVKFTEQVSLGDRVYSIEFAYKGEPYKLFVICDASTKKVIFDPFFNVIQL